MDKVKHSFCTLDTKPKKASLGCCNAVLLKLCPELYQSMYNPFAMNIKQDTIHMAQFRKLLTPLPQGAISLPNALYIILIWNSDLIKKVALS